MNVERVGLMTTRAARTKISSVSRTEYVPSQRVARPRHSNAEAARSKAIHGSQKMRKPDNVACMGSCPLTSMTVSTTRRPRRCSGTK